MENKRKYRNLGLGKSTAYGMMLVLPLGKLGCPSYPNALKYQIVHGVAK
jgi:hypothetical protein